MDMYCQALKAVNENIMADENKRKLLQEAELGDADAQWKIGLEYATHAFYDDVSTEAIKWLELAAKQGHVEAQFDLARYSSSETAPDFCNELQNDPDAVARWMQAAAEQGHVEAIRSMAYILPDDSADAARWLKKADQSLLLNAKRDLRYSSYLLFMIELHPDHFSIDDVAFVIALVRKEAERGDAGARRTLADLYIYGRLGVPADDEEALKWYNLTVAKDEECPHHFSEREIEVFRRNAARCGTRLQHCLGHFFERAEFGQCDLSEAARWYELAAAQGDAQAQFKIAWMYDRGEGVSQNDELAAKWFEKAATQGLSAAQHNLAIRYENGRGVEQSDRSARRWFLAAARHGDETAFYSLGINYLFGEGVRDEKKLAARWFRASSRRNYVWGTVALAVVTEENSDLVQAVETLFQQHQQVSLNSMEDCVFQLEEFRDRLDDLANRSPAPRNAPIWMPEWKDDSDDQRRCYWWRKLSVKARVATTLRGMLYLADHERDESQARDCFELAAKNGDQVAAYYLATMESRNESYHRALVILWESILPEHRQDNDGVEEPSYSDSFLNALEARFQELKQNIDESQAKKQEAEKLRQAEIKAAEDEHKRTLSFLTHTLNNTLSTGPETVRTVIDILGSDLYDQGLVQYKAINNMASLFPVFLFVESLLKTFKLYVSDPEQLREKWDSDRSGDASIALVLAMALRQSVARLVFSSNHLTQLRRLLPSQDKEAIKNVRKSFVDEMIPLELSVETAGKVFDWIKLHVGMLQIEIDADAEMHFSSNATRHMFFFAAFSELVYNALKYSDGTRPIQIKWYRDGSDYCFTCVNSFPVDALAPPAQEGANGGLFFIEKLMSMLRESTLRHNHESGEYRASLRFDHKNFGEPDA